MKNPWTKAVNELNKKKFVVPEGWSTREEVAKDLQCSPDKVADLLKPGLQSHEFEKADFSVWDEARRMTVRVTCYRIVGSDDKKDSLKSAKPANAKPVMSLSEISPEIIARIQGCIRRKPHADDRRIAMNAKVQVGYVRAVRALKP